MHTKNSYLFALAIFLLSGCISSDVKKLSSLTGSSNNTATNNAESFTVNLVYRDSSSDGGVNESHLVYIVGPNSSSSQNFSDVCGLDGSSCTCDFYTSTSASAVAASTVSFSQTNNTISCIIPGGTGTASAYKYARLRKVSDSAVSTGFLNIKNTLTLQDALGSTALSTSNVHKVYSYQCTKTFLEGEGISTSGIQCLTNQRLGYINANYNFYLYSDSTGTDSNLSSKSGDTYQSTFCGLSAVAIITCSNSPNNLKWGLYKTATGAFTSSLTFSSGPTATTSTIYGYAAIPDNAGNCPVGLVKARPYQAQPSSIITNTLDDLNPSFNIGQEHNQAGASCNFCNPPTNFINSNNSLNDLVIETSAPSNFIVSRAKNSGSKCDNVPDASGYFLCTSASQDSAAAIQSYAYMAQTPIICVIPASLLN